MSSCVNSSECCCGQECLPYLTAESSAYKNYSLACQCTSDRWWNNDLPYCRNCFGNNKF